MRCMWEDTEIYHTYSYVNWIELAENRIQWRSYVVMIILHDNMY
jgi:hypothetical protein